MKRHIEMVVTASILVGYDDAEMDASTAEEAIYQWISLYL